MAREARHLVDQELFGEVLCHIFSFVGTVKECCNDYSVYRRTEHCHCLVFSVVHLSKLLEQIRTAKGYLATEAGEARHFVDEVFFAYVFE